MLTLLLSTVTQQTEQQPRGTDGRFTRADDPIAKVELDLKFKRGEISTAEYLEQSGAIDSYLESQGIPLVDLQASVAEKQNQRIAQSWEQAVIFEEPRWRRLAWRARKVEANRPTARIK
jgi:hypothetical protein